MMHLFRWNVWFVLGLLIVVVGIVLGGGWLSDIMAYLGPKPITVPPSSPPDTYSITLGTFVVGILALLSGIYFNFRKDRREERALAAQLTGASTKSAAQTPSADDRRRERLRELLLNPPPGKEWLTMETLLRAVAADEAETTRLLLEIGARRSLRERNVWTLLAK